MAINAIPASEIVSVVPGVIGAGGSALDLNGLFITNSSRVPLNGTNLPTVMNFATPADVEDFFGGGSVEADAADVYFAGFENSFVKPANVLFAQYNTVNVSAYTRGGDIGVTLAQLQAFAVGTLTISNNGTPHTSSSINLASATSFSNAAAIIQAAFTTPPFSVAYDSVSGAFIFTNTSTGAASTVDGYISGTNNLATNLALTQASGAVISAGANAATPATYMGQIARTTQNWATFALTFDPDGGSSNTVKLAFCAWVATQNNRWAFACWDTDITPTQSTNAAGSIGQILKANNTSGVEVIYVPTASTNSTGAIAAFAAGYAASLDFTRTNGRTTLAFRSQSGLNPDVTDATVASNLLANGYNFYGAYATANDEFIWYYDGSVSGEFAWIDSYVNEIWLNNGLQLAFMTLLKNTTSIPYNPDGRALMEAAATDPITAGLNFGAIRQNVTLSAEQAAEVNAQAGIKIDGVLSTQGYYLQIKDAIPSVRAVRQSPPCTLWYMDGQSVQNINIASIEVQ